MFIFILCVEPQLTVPLAPSPSVLTQPDPTVFQWIYECVTSEDEGLRKYALQFVPDLVMVYLLAVTDNIAQVSTDMASHAFFKN